MRRNIPLVLGSTGLAAVLVLAVLGPIIWGDQAVALGGPSREGPSDAYWLGTDALGRDVFARTMAGTRLTIVTSVIATAVAVGLGVLIGSAVWLSGPRVREVSLRVIDVMISYPAIILALMVVAIIGASPTATVVAIGVAGCPSFARLTANLAGSVAGRDFIPMSRAVGVSPWRLLMRHFLPNMAEPLLILVSVAFASVLTALSGLSFLGLGVQAPGYDWGSLLGSGLGSLYTNPSEAVGPAVMIVFTGLCAGFIGDGLAAKSSRRPTLRRRPRLPTYVDVAPAPETSLLHVDRLSVVSPDGSALIEDVSFDVADGEIVGVVGESGSGKSITAMTIARLLDVSLHSDAAALRLGDLDLLTTTDRKRLATEIGIVFQDPNSSFNPALKLGGQLTETLRRHLAVDRTAARERAAEQLRAVRVTDADNRLTQYPHELSGGMRQRAMIAAALLTRPKLLIADEATTALDVTVQADVLSLLREINERSGTSMLFISHDIGVVSALCHRVLVMYAGRVVEELSVADLRAGHARHPYTRALLAATSTLGDDVGQLAAIPGRPPQPAQRPEGCVFSPRCPLARDVCREQRPTLRDGLACHAPDWEDLPSPSDPTPLEHA
jgi:oligopeptide/dipeptide ABC transporter ATP-binding protein